MDPPPESLLEVFAWLPEARKPRGRRYPQAVLLALATLSKLCGYHSFSEMARFVGHHPELTCLLGVPHSDLPSHDTFRYALSRLDPQVLDEAMGAWALGRLRAIGGPAWQAYALDGKSLRGTRDDSQGRRADHLLSLLHQDYRTVVAQQAVDGKSNEIVVAGQLMADLEPGVDLAGVLVTADALLTQARLAGVIHQRQGRYLLVIKDNQPTMKELVAEVFRPDLPPLSHQPVRPEQRSEQGLFGGA